MRTIEEIAQAIKKIKVTEDLEWINDVICAFEDFEFKGETEVMVQKNESYSHGHYLAYINHKDAPIISIVIEDGKIIDTTVDQ